jgi:hypothetical protein
MNEPCSHHGVLFLDEFTEVASPDHTWVVLSANDLAVSLASDLRFSSARR